MSPQNNAPADPERAPATESRRHDEETTPLLRNGHPSPSEANEEQTVLPQALSPTRLYLTLGAAYTGVFLGAIDTTIIATLAAPIASEFHSLSLLSWLASAYLIANAACQPLSGRLTDIVGRGPGLVFSNALFAAGNLLCGLAPSATAIILGRVVAGIGGGGLMAISTFLASDLVPLRQRGVVQGLGNICFGSGAMLGGVFGGLVHDRAARGWRLAFLVQVPVVAVSGLLVFFLVTVPPKRSRRSALARIDLVGAALTVAFLVVLLLGLNAGGNLVPWTHPLVRTTLPLAALLLAALVRWERRCAQPMLPVRLLAHRTVLAACTTNLVCTMAHTALLFYVPLYLQVLGHSATQAGLRLLCGSLGVAIASIGAGLVMKATGRYLGLGIAALALFVAGSAALVATTLGGGGGGAPSSTAAASSWVPFPALLLTGAGYGAMLTVTLLACLAAVAHAQQAVITSATYAFRSVGAALGVTAASVVYQNVLQARLWARFGGQPGAAGEIRRIREDLDALQHLPVGWRDGVLASFGEAFRGVFLTALGLAVVGLVCVSLMRQHKLHSNLARSDE